MSSLFPLLEKFYCDKNAEVRAVLEAHPEAAREKDKSDYLPLDHLVQEYDPDEPTTGPLLGALIEAAGGIDAELDSEKQTSRTILRGATREAYRLIAETFGAFLGRLKLVDEKKHGSGTCLVIFALDLKTGRPVALKLMEDRAQWVREQDMRKLDGGELLDSQHVVQILDAEELEADAGSMDPRLKGATEYRFLLVMPQARRDLSDALSHDQLAGRDKATVVQIAHQVARHLKYLNEGCGRVHGDLKPRNLVQMLVETASGQAEVAWVLIDLDASCDIGAPAGQKVTSECGPNSRQALRHRAECSLTAGALSAQAVHSFRRRWRGSSWRTRRARSARLACDSWWRRRRPSERRPRRPKTWTRLHP